MKKICSKCKLNKTLSKFNKSSFTKLKVKSCCKECQKKDGRIYRLNNKEKEKIRHKKYLENNRDKRRAYEKKYAKKNKKRILAYQYKWRQQNPDKVKFSRDKRKILHNKRQRDRYNHDLEYKKRVKIAHKKYEKTYKKRRYQLRKNKLNKNPHLKLLYSLRSNLYKNIVKLKINKIGSAVTGLGCSIDFFKLYIEKQFKIGMTWKNYGVKGWHLDHIIPIASFDLTDPDQFKKACHYTNLQPLWWYENLAKGAKILN